MSVYTLKDSCYAFLIIYIWFRPNVRLSFHILSSTCLASTILPISRLHTGKQINHVLSQQHDYLRVYMNCIPHMCRMIHIRLPPFTLTYIVSRHVPLTYLPLFRY